MEAFALCSPTLSHSPLPPTSRLNFSNDHSRHAIKPSDNHKRSDLDDEMFGKSSMDDSERRVRHRGDSRDALMELARENLILHQHLYLANVEVCFCK